MKIAKKITFAGRKDLDYFFSLDPPGMRGMDGLKRPAITVMIYTDANQRYIQRITYVLHEAYRPARIEEEREVDQTKAMNFIITASF